MIAITIGYVGRVGGCEKQRRVAEGGGSAAESSGNKEVNGD